MAPEDMEVITLKNEIANEYIKKFKDELGRFKSLAILPIENKIKDIITSDKDVGTKFADMEDLGIWKGIIGFLSPPIAKNIYDFVKEKKEIIAVKKTKEELELLKQEVTGIIPTTTPITTPITTTTSIPTKNTTEQGTKNTTTPIKNTTSISTKNTTEQGMKKQTEQGTENKGKKETVVVAGSVGIAGVGITAEAIKKINILKQSKQISSIELTNPKEFAVKMQEQFTNIATDLEKSIQDPHLVQIQRINIMNSAEEFRAVAKQIDEGTINNMQMLQKLKDKLPLSILKSITQPDAEKLFKLSPQFWETFRSAKVGEDMILLEKQGIKLNKEVISVLKTAKDLPEIKGMVAIMKGQKGIFSFLEGMKGILAIDLIITGVNIWVLTNELDEAEAYKKINKLRGEIKKDRARVQFGTTTALMALETIGMYAAFGASMGGGIGLIVGLGIGAGTWAVSQAIDIYYDAVEFNLQSEDQLKSQYRIELKETIISSAASEKWNLNMNSRLSAIEKKKGYSRFQRHYWPFGITLLETEKITITGDAWKSLIWQEEYINEYYSLIQRGAASGKTEDEFKTTLSASELTEYDKQKKALNIVIDKRMEYIKKFMHPNENSVEYKQFVSAMQNSMGIKMIEKILADSKVYYDMGQTGDDQYILGCSTIEDYKKKYKEKLQADDATRFTQCETMRTTEPDKFLELYYGMKNYEMSVFDTNKDSDSYVYKNKATEIQKRIDFINHYYAYKTLGIPTEDQKKWKISSESIDFNQIENILVSGQLKTDILNVNTKDVKGYFISDQYMNRMESNIQVSDSVGQNIIYRIAVEFHGYTGSNDSGELMEFFRRDKGDVLGLYYTNQWKINNDWAIDKGIDIDDFENMTTAEILEERISPSYRNSAFNLVDPIAVTVPGANLFGFINNTSMIATKADAGNMDKKMNEEYRTKIKAIIVQEKSYKKPETKKIIEQNIIAYIQKNSRKVGKEITYDQKTREKIESLDKEQGYIKLPYYLVIQAKKAGIGDLRKYLFKYENNQISACTTKLYLDEKPDFSQTHTIIQKEYVSGTREALDNATQKYIDYIDEAKNEFEKIITFKNISLIGLNIPKEYLKIYRTEINRWEELKQSLFTLDPTVSKAQLTDQNSSNYYKKRHDYFEGMYVGILEVISESSSNQLDSSEGNVKAKNIATQLSNIHISSEGKIEGPLELLNEKQQSVFIALFVNQKVDGKKIDELAKSSNADDQAKAIWATRQVLKSMLEGRVLSFYGKDGNDFIVYSGDAKTSIYPIAVNDDGSPIKETPETRKNAFISYAQERIKKNVDIKKYFDPNVNLIKAKSVDISKIGIKKLTGKPAEVIKIVGEIQKIIEATQPDDVYIGRGKMTFDSETNKFGSWGKETVIDPENLKISGLNITCKSISELISVVEIVNRFKANYPGVKSFVFDSRLGFLTRGIYNGSTRVLTLDTIKLRMPSILDENNDVKVDFLNYINSVT